MFDNTLTITINSVAKVLNRINQDKYSSEYFLREADGEFRLRIRNTSYTDKNRGGTVVDRHNLELIHTLYPSSEQVKSQIAKFYAVFELDQGADIAANSHFVVGGVGFLTSSNVTKMANWES
jgi:hypothetical protein